MDTIKLELVTPEKLELSTDAELVEAPGTEGDFGVLPGHSPFISALKAGVVSIHLGGGETRKIFVVGGVAEVNESACTILAEQTRDLTGASLADAQGELARAKEAAAQAISEDEQRAAQKQLQMAEALVSALG